MNRHQKKILSLTAAIANLSFTCVVAGVATYAWFYQNDTVHANGMEISAAPEIILDYTILRYDDDLKKGVSTHNDPSSFILPEYDYYIKARNVYSNIIIRAGLTFGRPIDTTNKEIKIDFTKYAESSLKDADGIRLLTSNVAQFKCIATSYTPAASDVPVTIPVGIQEVKGDYKDVDDAMYRTASAYFAGRKTPSTFISLMNGQPVDPENGNTITLVPELYNVGVVKHAVVYIECSYNDQLVSGFVEDHPNESIHNLTGDIESIDFAVNEYTNNRFGQPNTGQYLRMNDVGGSYSGSYLAAYSNNENRQMLDGTLTTGSETIGTSSGINASNQYDVVDFMRHDSSAVYATDRIEDAALYLDRENGTYKSSNGHYVGNNTSSAGIISRSSITGLSNSLAYNGNNAVVKSTVNTNMQLKYDSTNSKFAYYNNTNSDISLYRYHENDIIDATLTSLSVTGPTGDDATLSVGEYFNLKGVSCIATYTKPNNTTFTINVTTACNYSTSEEGILLPNQTQFTTINANKVINVSYTDHGVTKTGSFTLNVVSDVLQTIEITSPVARTLYAKGDAFDTTGLVVTGNFATTGAVDVTSQCTFSIGGTLISNGGIINTAGENVVVTVHYNGTSTTGPAYEDKTFTITVKTYSVDITEENEDIYLGNSLTIHVSYNGNLDWTITGATGALSFTSEGVTTSTTTTYTGSDYAMQSTTITVYGLAGGTATLTAKIHGTTDISDSCTIRVIDASALFATYTVSSSSSVVESDITPDGSTADYSNTYSSNQGQMTAGNTTTLTLHGYEGYKINRIVFSMKSNKSAGSGNMTVIVGGTTTICSISTATFSDITWNGSYTQEFTNVEKTMTSRPIRTGEDVVITISATVNSLYCQSYTVYYEAAEFTYANTLELFDNETEITGGTKTINSGSIGDTWSPTALVTYTNNSSDSDVTWAITDGEGATINASTGVVTFNTASGTVTVSATTNSPNSNNQFITRSFTLTWSNFNRVLSTITVSNPTTEFEVGDTFTFGGTVTANYNDNTQATIPEGQYTVDTSGVDMTNAGTYTVNVSYTENGVTRTTSYTITVSGGTIIEGDTETIIFSEQGYSNQQAVTSTAGTYSTITFDKGTNSNAPKYYDTGSAMRCYGGNTFTVSSTTKTIVKIELSFASGENNNEITTDVITYNNSTATWTGSSNSITFTIGGSSGHRRITQVKITYAGGTVSDAELVSIALSGEYQTQFTVGDTFTHEGIVVTATYDDETTKNVTADAAFTGYDMTTAGNQTITVSYTENGVTKEATYSITVGQRVLDHIEVSEQTRTYSVNGTWSFAGTVTATYNNGSTKDVTADVTFSGNDLTTAGEKTVTASYTENGVTKTDTFVITVTAASYVTDEITVSTTGRSGTSYGSWSDKTLNSTAVYAGQSAAGNDSIQLRSSNSNSGIITTASGGTVVEITITFNTNTADGRTVWIFGSNTAYTNPSELYSSSTQGTELQRVTYSTSDATTVTQTIVVTGNYAYIGIRSGSGALYLDSVTIKWLPN